MTTPKNPLPHRKLRVLVVEDEYLVALQTEEMLIELGFEVVGPATRFDQALGMAQSAAIDAAVIDVNLRGVAIYPIADVLAGRAIPFAFATGYAANGVAPAYRDRPVLQKPFLADQLATVMAAIVSVLEAREAEG